ncbi:heterokaryon incompatibility protein-domain-containing protein [Tricladium varicosporioides]|nr:heterokaryon incompatibility protein-domain-containing protein [Hymenoscyphus varicosporioides]
MLCNFCANINFDQVNSQDGYKHHSSYVDLYDSADKGCELCSLIRETQVKTDSILGLGDWPDELDRGDVGINQVTIISEWTLVADKSVKESHDTIQIRQKDRRAARKPRKRHLDCALNTAVLPSDPLSKLILNRPPSRNPASDECFTTAINWLRHCQQNHPLCAGELQQHKLPTRVIDVGPADGSQSSRLYLTNKVAGEWVTLSWCWGASQPVKTTLATLQAHQVSLPLAQLPPIFNDAIAITRRLGYRYLWIDSLCIIQDSTEDWTAEAANMGNIYKYSAFTIVAEAVFDDTQSILDGIRPSQWPVTIPYHRSKGSLKGKIFLRPDFDFGRDITKWESRAWTMQEDALSPRSLKWSTQELVWSCRTAQYSEEDIDGRTFAQRSAQTGVAKFKEVCLSPKNLQITSGMIKYEKQLKLDYNNYVLGLWLDLLVRYLRRNITFHNDRLPAISGFAKEIARHTGYNYKAGLWEQNIHMELVWHVYEDSGNPRDVEYMAPSWSWASMKHPCGCHYEDGVKETVIQKTTPLAEILKIEVINFDDDPFARVKSGHLVMRSKARYVRPGDEDCGHYIPDRRVKNEENTIVNERNTPPVPPEALCFQILLGSSISCLVLEDVAGSPGTYRRIGKAWFQQDLQVEDWKIMEITVI